jgi:hypothetical protein
MTSLIQEIRALEVSKSGIRTSLFLQNSTLWQQYLPEQALASALDASKIFEGKVKKENHTTTLRLDKITVPYQARRTHPWISSGRCQPSIKGSRRWSGRYLHYFAHFEDL